MLSISYKMKFILFALLVSLNLSASIYKGQKEYVNNCVSCHTTGQSFIVTKTQKEWNVLLDEKGTRLAKLHISKLTARRSYKYFQSNRYEKYSKYLKEFLVEYAKDSGKIPACN